MRANRQITNISPNTQTTSTTAYNPVALPAANGGDSATQQVLCEIHVAAMLRSYRSRQEQFDVNVTL